MFPFLAGRNDGERSVRGYDSRQTLAGREVIMMRMLGRLTTDSDALTHNMWIGLEKLQVNR